MGNENMQPFIKWAGGKSSEIPIIEKYFPRRFNRYIEPFIGGGAVFLHLNHNKSLINDLSTELIDLYSCIKNNDSVFFEHLESIYASFREIDVVVDNNIEEIIELYQSRLSIPAFVEKHTDEFKSIGRIDYEEFSKQLTKNLSSKITRSAKLEKVKTIPDSDRVNNMECAIKSAYYMTIRHLYNTVDKKSKSQRTALFYFVREYCYSSMFRYNSKGEFNVPYGGISYNRKNFENKIDYLKSLELKDCLAHTEIYNADFEDFLKEINPKKDDFIFLDPPYDSDFSTYCMNEFDKEAQVRLHNCLSKTKANIMLVIKETPFIRDLYKDDFNTIAFDKNYLVSFKNRNNKAVNHLIITNY